jgi:hypothetical protein
MRALFLRFYKFTGPVGLLMVLGGVLMAPLFIIVIIQDGWGTLNSSYIFGLRIAGSIIAAAMATMMAVRGYKRSSRTVSHEDALLPLVRSEREYCLVLRPFGRDGEVIIPKASPKGRVGIPLTFFTRNETMEQLVAAAARSALGLETYGIVDQDILFAPPGVTFIRVPNNEWKMVAQFLIRRAHTIVLILHPGQEMREGFAWEIEQIVRYGMQSRVVIALPPCDEDVDGHRAALVQACIILALLDDSGREVELNHFKVHEYELLSSPTTLLVRHTERAGPNWWEAKEGDNSQQGAVDHGRRKEKRKEKRENRRKKVVADLTYLPGFVEAFNAVEKELSELSFKARYPLK